jgi:hypothetical protein
MRQVHGHDVRDHDQRRLRVPDEVTVNDVDLVASCAEEVSLPSPKTAVEPRGPDQRSSYSDDHSLS